MTISGVMKFELDELPAEADIYFVILKSGVIALSEFDGEKYDLPHGDAVIGYCKNSSVAFNAEELKEIVKRGGKIA